MPLVIALTGGIGSGKSSVATILRELGAAIVDTDEISHGLTAPGQPGARAIAAEFGPEYLRSDGALDRGRMRELAFSDLAAKRKLEAILHPLIRAEAHARVRAAAHESQAPYVVIAVPLLIETGAYRDLAQRILVVDSDEKQQIARVMQRDGLSAAAVQAIIDSQASRSDRLKHADDIVHNDGDLAALRAQVSGLHHGYMTLARGTSNHVPGTAS